MERCDQDVGAQIQIQKFSFDAANLRHARQKDQKTAWVLCERAPDRLYDCYIDMAGERPVEVACLDWKEPAFTCYHRRLAQEIRDRPTIQRGRHHEQTKIRTKEPLRFETEGQTYVGLQA